MLRDLFATRTGVKLSVEARFALERRLRERLIVLNLATFADYHHYLRFSTCGRRVGRSRRSPDYERDVLLPRRSAAPGFQQELLPLLQAQGRAHRRLTVWSAGCSTGEEAYTIAILVHQSGLFFPRRRLAPSPPLSAFPESSATDEPPLWDVRIYGSDISRRCVAAARRGVYRESSFRATSDEVRASCFVQQADGWRVTESIRQLCRFGKMNLTRRRAVKGARQSRRHFLPERAHLFRRSRPKDRHRSAL
jgi:chemotaxis protein methyltransferase CheR